ncbi:MAG: hypothetical protein QNI87_07695 [Erythrobacter sp.]|uniref:hypothetical protein n=1 Tax=Erythrobacter sp. TaxID=1042 RepID=UPI00261683BF|nr:hypothetical protein [Erythrobacter sp.]MDJ0978404.1 hypothetical protein [Erythrobacter sp.]
MPSSISSSEASHNARSRARLIALIAAFVGLVVLGLAVWLAMPLSPVSDGRYLAAAQDKVAMLKASKGEKDRVVLIGGSGAAFSISAETLTHQLGRPVYNGGLQAGVGLRNLVDLYAPHLDPENDLIVLLPEPEMLASDARYSQTWCDVIFLRKALSALLARPRCVPNILWRTWQEGQHHMTGEATIDPVYRRLGFNARGDLTSHLGVERPAPDFSAYDHPDIDPEDLRVITDHVRGALSGQGLELLYVPAAMPAAGCERSPERIAAMARELARLTNADAPVPDTAPFCLPPPLFFDGAGHLNARGRAIQTDNVARAIARYLETER